MQDRLITAIEMARDAGLNPKRFRQALRDAGLTWHVHNQYWTVRENTREHRDMLAVLNDLTKR